MFISFKQYLNQQRLVTPRNHILVAVSGGIDSMVLLHLFMELATEWELTLSVAHVNYKLRAEQSDGDEAFIRDYCQQANIAFYSREADSLPEGENFQQEARKYRYAFFEELANRLSIQKIATAHHLDDQIEGILLNFIRGCGPRGLEGMVSHSFLGHCTLIRPLLFASRQEIEQVAEKKKMAWRQDSSNERVDYRRNFLRHRILPLLKELNPNLLQAAKRLGESLLVDNACLEREAGVHFRAMEVKGNDGVLLPLNMLKSLDPAIRIRVLKEAYRRLTGRLRDLNFDQLLHMNQLVDSEKKNGRYHLPHGIQFMKRDDCVCITRKPKP